MIKYYTAEQINREIEKMIEGGYTPPTRLQRVQEGRKILIVDNSLMGAGFVRTYEQARKYFQRRHGKDKEYTKAEYKESLKELNEFLQSDEKPELTFKQVESRERQRIKLILDDLETVTGKHYNIEDYDTKALNEAIKEAGQRVLEKHSNSPKFYEYLSDIISEI